jgi:hypothetical protein
MWQRQRCRAASPLNEQMGTVKRFPEAQPTTFAILPAENRRIGQLAMMSPIPERNVSISVAGTEMVSGDHVAETLQARRGRRENPVRAHLRTRQPDGRRIQGTIDSRDGPVTALRTDVNTLASSLINEVNIVHATGFSLTGSTGEKFFTGTNASDIQVNGKLVSNPALLQASADASTVGDNRTALALAQLADKKHSSLDGQTFSQRYGQAVAALGQGLSSVNTQLSDQQAVEKMFQQQRDSISGVSLKDRPHQIQRLLPLLPSSSPPLMACSRPM